MVVRPVPKSAGEQLADLEREEAHYSRLAQEQGGTCLRRHPLDVRPGSRRRAEPALAANRL